MAWLGEAWHGEAGLGWARQGRAWRGWAGPGMARQGKVGHGEAWPGGARQGVAWRGKARLLGRPVQVRLEHPVQAFRFAVLHGARHRLYIKLVPCEHGNLLRRPLRS